MKRLIAILLTCLMALSLFLPILAQSSSHHWYIRHKESGSIPEIDITVEKLLSDCDGYYVDRYSHNSQDKVIYLTFDAGYENGNVAKILDILHKEEVKGGFFVLSHLIKSNPELLKRMANEGHLVCNHTATHKDPTNMTCTELEKELVDLATLYEQTTENKMAPYFRPPQGHFNRETLETAQKMGYKTVFWSLAYADWDEQKAPSDEKAKELLKRRTHNGAVILLHPTSAINVRILPEMIRYWKNEGYRFGSLDELTDKD